MALPLIPFAAGVAVGAIVTYGYKDEELHREIQRGLLWTYDNSLGALIRFLGYGEHKLAEAKSGLESLESKAEPVPEEQILEETTAGKG